MPQALLAVIPALIGAGVTAGQDIYSSLNQPSAPKAATTTSPGGPTQAQIVSAAAPYAANIQALTGGTISPDYVAQNAPLQAGVAGQPNTQNAMAQLVTQLFGGSGTNNASQTFSPSGEPTNATAAFTNSPGVSDFMQKMAASLT